MRLGAVHTPTPATIQPFSQRAKLQLMTAPPRVDWFAKNPADRNALGNGRIGNCVPCAMLRAQETRRANAWSDVWAPTEAEAVALYSTLTGYDPATGLPDDGTDTAQAMSHWAVNGILGDVVLWTTVDHNAVTHVSLAIAHTGPVQVTLSLPIAADDVSTWAKSPGDGAGWEPGSWGNHRVLVGAYDGLERVCRTWGQDVVMHPEFFARYCIGVDVTLSREWLDTTGVSPAGLDWDALRGDIDGLAL